MSSSEDVEPSYRVLLVDDSPLMQKLTGGLLDRAGHQVTIAKTGKEAVAAVQSDAFDIVLMDVEMPDMNGLEATRRIRRQAAATMAQVPNVGLTNIDRQTCLNAGMDKHLQKPAHADELLKVLEETIAERRQVREGQV